MKNRIVYRINPSFKDSKSYPYFYDGRNENIFSPRISIRQESNYYNCAESIKNIQFNQVSMLIPDVRIPYLKLTKPEYIAEWLEYLRVMGFETDWKIKDASEFKTNTEHIDYYFKNSKVVHSFKIKYPNSNMIENGESCPNLSSYKLSWFGFIRMLHSTEYTYLVLKILEFRKLEIFKHLDNWQLLSTIFMYNEAWDYHALHKQTYLIFDQDTLNTYFSEFNMNAISSMFLPKSTYISMISRSVHKSEIEKIINKYDKDFMTTGDYDMSKVSPMKSKMFVHSMLLDFYENNKVKVPNMGKLTNYDGRASYYIVGDGDYDYVIDNINWKIRKYQAK